MQPRLSPLIVVATGAGLLTVHLAILLGGAMREAAVAFCAFALLVAAPIAVLAWLGSLSDLGEMRRRHYHKLKRQRAEAALWQRTLLELQPSAFVDGGAVGDGGPVRAGGLFASQTAIAVDEPRPVQPYRIERTTTKRRILAHLAMAASALGLAACAAPEPSPWLAVAPGMGTAELTALVGPPQQIKSNGSVEVWQYCRTGFLERDGQFDQFGRQPLIKRTTDHYVAVWIENEQVRQVKPYPVVSRASCDDFFQAVW